MPNSRPTLYQDIFPVTWSLITDWVKSEILEQQLAPKGIPSLIEDLQDALPGYLADLAGLELAAQEAAGQGFPKETSEDLRINPHLQILCPSWKGLPELIKAGSLEAAREPEPGQDSVLVWPQPDAGKVRVRSARPRDLLALKIAAEGLSPAETAKDHAYPVFQKDNLLSAVLHQRGQPLFGGCTGFGCGAAFNFVSLLPDAEVHSCRKFPSYLGNIFEQTLDDIYDSQQAGTYRAGPAACRDCSIRPVCRGCLAVVHSLGLDVSTDRDPFCPLPS